MKAGNHARPGFFSQSSIAMMPGVFFSSLWTIPNGGKLDYARIRLNPLPTQTNPSLFL
jgi:hypothetical protein